MSTFGGRIKEFPGISIDQFENTNLESTIYFLSHVHSDHMRGMSAPEFQTRILHEKLYCYSSEVTTRMLQEWYPTNAQQFRYLNLNVPHHLKTEDLHFSVTLLPAKHCPGSVMFLFENDDHTILYSGDFRLNVADLKCFKGLYNSLGILKNITKIHLDTTFMLKKYSQFPSRKESIDALCILIEEWITKSPQHVIQLETGCKYGCEYIFDEVYQRFHTPIHVNEREHEVYRYFPNMDKCITLNNDVRIHANCNGHRYYCNQSDKTLEKRRIKLSALMWRDWGDGSAVSVEGFNIHRVCYSSHSSYNELREILNFLAPDEIEANVNQQNEEDQMEMTMLIEKCLDEIKDKKYLNDAKAKRRKLDVEQKHSDDDDEELLKLIKIQAKEKPIVNHGLDLSILDW